MSEYAVIAKYAELAKEARDTVDAYERARFEHISFADERASFRQEQRYQVAFHSQAEAKAALELLTKAPRLISELQAALRVSLMERQCHTPPPPAQLERNIV